MTITRAKYIFPQKYHDKRVIKEMMTVIKEISYSTTDRQSAKDG